MHWQIGVTPNHWLYEVWINGLRAPDAIAVDSVGRAIVMRWGGHGYERDCFDRVKADLVLGSVEIRRTNAPADHVKAGERDRPAPYDVVVHQTQEVIRLGGIRSTLAAAI